METWLIFWYSYHSLNAQQLTINIWTGFIQTKLGVNHLNTGHVWYSDPHWLYLWMTSFWTTNHLVVLLRNIEGFEFVDPTLSIILAVALESIPTWARLSLRAFFFCSRGCSVSFASIPGPFFKNSLTVSIRFVLESWKWNY